jgi:hypothetical protein
MQKSEESPDASMQILFFLEFFWWDRCHAHVIQVFKEGTRVVVNLINSWGTCLLLVVRARRKGIEAYVGENWGLVGEYEGDVGEYFGEVTAPWYWGLVGEKFGLLGL